MAIQIPPSQFAHHAAPTPNKAAKSASAGEVLTNKLSKALAGTVKIGDKQSPEVTAKNILRHVENGLNQLKAQGASAERIAQRLQAAREGIDKGYAQANEMLKGLGMLDEELKGQIAAGRKLVDEGLDSLAKQDSTKLDLLPVRSSSLQHANELTLSVLTRDGDRVTVNFAQQKSAALSQSDQSSSLTASMSQSWSMRVEGSLSEAEQGALSSLFQDVQDLSERFFAGDLGSALEKAMNLGLDGKNLASMSLNLLSRSQFTSVAPYQAAQELPTPELESLKAPLASYVDSYLNALEKAKPLAEPANTLQQIMAKLLPEESRMPVWQAFHEGLNGLLALPERTARS